MNGGGDSLARGQRSAVFGPPRRKMTDEEYAAMFLPEGKENTNIKVKEIVNGNESSK